MVARLWVLGLVLWSWFSVATAEEFTDKVIGVSDGDTVTVLREQPPVKVPTQGYRLTERSSRFALSEAP